MRSNFPAPWPSHILWKRYLFFNVQIFKEIYVSVFEIILFDSNFPVSVAVISVCLLRKATLSGVKYFSGTFYALAISSSFFMAFVTSQVVICKPIFVPVKFSSLFILHCWQSQSVSQLARKACSLVICFIRKTYKILSVRKKTTVICFPVDERPTSELLAKAFDVFQFNYHQTITRHRIKTVLTCIFTKFKRFTRNLWCGGEWGLNQYHISRRLAEFLWYRDYTCMCANQ